MIVTPMTSSQRNRVVFLLACLLLGGSTAWSDSSKQFVVETIVASVDGQPITLRDIGKKIGRPLRADEAAKDPQVRAALDGLIQEQIVRLEAQSRQITVSSEEVQSYVAEVASRNNLTVEELRATVEKQQRRYDDYLKEVEFDILRTKLAGSYLRGSVSVTEREIDAYLGGDTGRSAHGKRSGTVDLSQLLVDAKGKSQFEVERLAWEITRLLDDEEDFEDVASELIKRGKSAESSELGSVAVGDLSPEISDTIAGLEEGKVSKPLLIGTSLRLFRVNGRSEGSGSDKEDAQSSREVSSERREEVRAIIQQKRMQERMENFFSEELMKRHSVEKKL